ncbi:unnamed protein product [Caenorhabditis brenneri]
MSIALAVILCHEKRKLLENEEGLLEDLATKVENKEIEYGHLKDKFEIDERNLELIDNGFLGSGHFGRVQKCNLTHVNGREKMMVAVKQAKNNREKQEVLIKEILISAYIPKHENILSLVGAVTTKANQTLMITALARCDLKKYFEEVKSRLKDNNKFFTDLIKRNEDGTKTGRYLMDGFEFSKDINQLSTFDLHFFAFQITRGMEYLAGIPCVHRDLALRNIFITDNKIVKIGDLGLARKHDKYKEYYNQKTYNDLPPRMAPEIVGISINNKFSEKSDVWPCTLALYDIFTLAENESLDVYGLQRKEWPPEPKNCLSETYEFMKFGWAMLPSRRPTFAQYRLHFEIEMKKFPSQIFRSITKMLNVEKEEQDKWKSWVREDPKEVVPQGEKQDEIGILIKSQEFKKNEEENDVRRIQVSQNLKPGKYGNSHHGLFTIKRPTFSECTDFFAQLLNRIDFRIRPQVNEKLQIALNHQRNLRISGHEKLRKSGHVNN